MGSRASQNAIDFPSRPLRVLHISDIEAPSYYFNNLCDFTDNSEIRFYSITFASRAGFVEELEKRGVPSYALNAMNRRQYPYAARRIWKRIKEDNVDIVHLHLLVPTFIGLVVAKLCGRKVVVTRHHSDAVHQIQNRVKRKFYLSIENYINRHADHLIAPSRMVRDILVEQEGVPATRVSLIPYGQTVDRFDAITPEIVARTKEQLRMNGQMVLVCNSRLYERKGHIYLFEALAPLIRQGLNATLFLIGRGGHQARLEQLAEQMGLKNHVQFLGWRNDALAIMAAADIIVHPSLEDALSQALIESLMLGRPIIASDISGVRDILDEGKYGVIVPPADAGALRRALENTILDIDKARERASPGRNHIVEYMNARVVARAYTECYKKVWSLG